MTRTILAALLLLALAPSAWASAPPIEYMMSRAHLASACAALDPRGEGWGLDAAAGPYGCRNTENGNTVSCTENGLCTDYSGDARRKRIREILKGEPARNAGGGHPLRRLTG
jgi:hypothetical protein